MACLDDTFREKMKEHPPEFQEIANTKEEMCGAKDDGYTCTLKKGHTCDHVAHGVCIHHQWSVQ